MLSILLINKETNQYHYLTEFNGEPYQYVRRYDKHGNMIYYENGDGYWCIWLYDELCREVYYENVRGDIWCYYDDSD